MRAPISPLSRPVKGWPERQRIARTIALIVLAKSIFGERTPPSGRRGRPRKDHVREAMARFGLSKARVYKILQQWVVSSFGLPGGERKNLIEPRFMHPADRACSGFGDVNELSGKFVDAGSATEPCSGSAKES